MIPATAAVYARRLCARKRDRKGVRQGFPRQLWPPSNFAHTIEQISTDRLRAHGAFQNGLPDASRIITCEDPSSETDPSWARDWPFLS